MLGQLWGCLLHNVGLEILFETDLDRDLIL